MAHAQMVDCFVRELLRRTFDEVSSDGLGYDLPLPAGQHVRVVGHGQVLRVLVAAVAAEGLAPTFELLEAVNHLNSQLPYGRVWVEDGRLLVEQSLLGDTLEWVQLDDAIQFVGWVVTNHGVELARRFGGESVADPQPPLPGLADATADVTDAVRPVTDTTHNAGRGVVGIAAAGYL